MSFSMSEETSTSSSTSTSTSDHLRLPTEIHWEALDKSKFFLLGAALFSAVSAFLHPAVVLKTRLQIHQIPTASTSPTATSAAASILRLEGPAAFYQGFATSLAGTIPARALYMAALESTKSLAAASAARLGVPEPAAAAAASAAAGLAASVAAQLVWTPVDVVSQRLMVQKRRSPPRYAGGLDACLKIVRADGVRGLYRGFGMSVLTYAPSSAVWWASYSTAQRAIWAGVECFLDEEVERMRTEYGKVALVQGLSAAVAGGASAVVTMPLDTIKTRMQVMECGEERTLSVRQTVRRLVREGGWGACYRGLGPRWASMSFSATTMITTYEFLKRLSAKEGSL